ncbi:hypothetical protein HKBW3C_01908 [Candidatus Hakubella thermalkaliphila]|nr:hypothetical protein HKBW3C_01908 [Candidatus Hakubella thermalkaliphila]
MKVSIIIPLYNEEHTILEVLDRVKAVDCREVSYGSWGWQRKKGSQCQTFSWGEEVSFLLSVPSMFIIIMSSLSLMPAA